MRTSEPAQDAASRLNRSSVARPASAMFTNFTAACRSNRPSLRRASQTLPIPPWPICEIRCTDQVSGPPVLWSSAMPIAILQRTFLRQHPVFVEKRSNCAASAGSCSLSEDSQGTLIVGHIERLIQIWT